MLLQLLGLHRANLAVDLGTANTLISVAGEGVVLHEPSVVAVQRDTGKVLSGGCAIGHLAKQMLGRTPDSIRVEQPLREGVIADYRLCEAMLRYFLRKAQRGGWGPRPCLLIAVPDAITPVQRRAVYNSAQRAGAGKVFLIAEAMAAAIGCGLPVAEPVASMVCDIGGGTSEVAAVSLGQSVAMRSIRVGGDHMDLAVVDYLRRNYSLKIGRATAERLRIDVGSAFPLPEELTDQVSGTDAISGLPRKATITSEEIRAALAEPLERIIETIKLVLDALPPDLASDVMEHGLVLAGGGSLLRGLDRLIGQQTGIPVRVSPDATSAVVKGAQLCLENLAQWRPLLTCSDDDV